MTKIDAARQEYKDWSRLMGVETLSKLNETLAEGRGIWLINLCEARQERKYVEAADAICGSGKRIIMMSGPSSSGKTSSSLRIAQQCRVLGIFPRVLELDNYFVERDRTPRDENGEYDFESIGAMDTDLLQDNIKDLLAGGGDASYAQQRVMAFPVGTSSQTRFLHVSGVGGTGKTLCIIARIMQDLKAQEATEDGVRRRGLFVSFNRSLAEHAKAIFDAKASMRGRVDVVNFDMLVNSLVKGTPVTDADYRHFAAYGHDVRYPASWHIEYDTARYVAAAMGQVAVGHPDLAGAYYLDNTRSDNVEWVDEEIQWLEERYGTIEEARSLYPTAERVGRGGARRPNAQVRSIILEVWDRYLQILAEEHAYTIAQATKLLMRSRELPAYASIAIDEAQDLSLLRIKALVRLRADADTYVYIAGDVNQKVYHRDFSWKELADDSQGVRGYTITLKRNMRNPESVRKFAERLLGRRCDREVACQDVEVIRANERDTCALLKDLVGRKGETTVVIGNANAWKRRGGIMGLTVRTVGERGCEKGSPEGVLYVSWAKAIKGLEFDNVLVDLDFTPADGDPQTLRNLRYVHFTRARRKLYVRYGNVIPELLKQYYADFL